jgi:hypothetical protein
MKRQEPNLVVNLEYDFLWLIRSSNDKAETCSVKRRKHMLLLASLKNTPYLISKIFIVL